MANKEKSPNINIKIEFPGLILGYFLGFIAAEIIFGIVIGAFLRILGY